MSIGYRLCVLGGRNGWVGDRVKVRVGITGAFGVQEKMKIMRVVFFEFA